MKLKADSGEAGEHLHPAIPLLRAGEQAAQARAYGEATEYLERALKLLRDQTDDAARALRGTIHFQLGVAQIERGQWPAADEQLAASLELARELGDRQRRVKALVMLGQSAFKQGNFSAAERYLPEAITLAGEIDDQAQQALAEMWLGAVAAIQHNAGQAAIHLQRALTLAREADDPALVGRITNILGENARLQGDYGGAFSHYQEALATYRAIDHRFGILLVTHNLGHVTAALGDYPAALEHYRTALRLAMEIQATPPGLETLAGLAELKVAQGEPERALDLLGLVLDHPACPEEARRLFAEPLLAQLRAALPHEIVEAGLERGRALDYASVVEELLAEG